MNDIPEQITCRTRNGAQTYIRIAIEDCTTKDGRQTRYVVWSSECRVCGCPFQVTTSTTKAAIARGPGTVHCAAHRRHGACAP